ncbi:MAG: zinc ribbon domain-containing protein [Methanobacteriaceae archaeon]|nr:zinc ribbon domain-containing protein [Methanobacteriaceae archaeon]
MFCTECGAANIDEAKYCQECGNILTTNNTEKEQIQTKNEKFDILMRNSGFLTIGLGAFIGLFNINAGLLTIFLGALMLLLKKVVLLPVIGTLILLAGIYNIFSGNNFGLIQFFMAITFFYSSYQYRDLI